MSEKVNLRCPFDNDTSVFRRQVGTTDVIQCDRCGGTFDGQEWHWECVSCSIEVEMGKLEGLFVPHLCHECYVKRVANDLKKGNKCIMCGAPRSLCCC